MMSSDRLLKIVVLGPAQGAGGMATCIQLQMASSLGDHAELRLFDNSKRTRADRPLWQGIVAQVRLLCEWIVLLITHRPDIVHIHTCSGPTFYRNSLDAVLAKLTFSKVVWHIHGAQFDVFLSGLRGVLRRWCHWMLARADAVIVLGKSWERVLGNFCPSARRAVIENGILIPPPQVRKADGPVNVIFLGDLSKRKGIDDLIAASSACSADHCLRIIGPDVENRLASLRQDLAGNANQERIQFLGTLAPERVAAELVDANVFVLPSYAEGLPMAMLEAMAAGLPVVVTNVGAIPEVIADDQNGFMINPGDRVALRERLECLIGDSHLRMKIGRAGRETVRDRFGYDRVARQLAELYDALIPTLRSTRLQPS